MVTMNFALLNRVKTAGNIAPALVYFSLEFLNLLAVDHESYPMRARRRRALPGPKFSVNSRMLYRTSIGCKLGGREPVYGRNGTFLLLKNATTATFHPIFETSKSPLRKSPNLQIPNPLYLCRFPDYSRRQMTTDFSGWSPTLSAIPLKSIT